MTTITKLCFLPFAITVLAACQNAASNSGANSETGTTNANIEKATTTPMVDFKASTKSFPREEKNRRQWDAPVVADLDQDGYDDLIINDHGFAIRVMWNNRGKFSKPYDVLMGDSHGVSAADFDADGNVELIISRGGGSGSNARNSKIYQVSKQRQFTPLADFNEPLAMMRGRTVKFVDIDNDGDLDLLNFAFPSREKKGKSENYLYENTDGELTLKATLPASFVDGQKVLITDFNQDNLVDILMYGHGAIKAYQGTGNFSFTDVSDAIFPFKLKDVTSISEIDYDNDGDFDLFFTRGKDFNAGENFYNKKLNAWGFYNKRGAFDINHLQAGEVLTIENLQSQWPNKALHLGESAYDYQFSGETHSGRNLKLDSSDVLGFPDTLNNPEKKGTYIGYIGNRNWRIAGNIWSPSTGILRQLEKAPQGAQYIVEQDELSGLADIMLENRNGKFVDASKALNLDFDTHTTGATVADIDNNGFSDLVITVRGYLVTQNKALVFLNNGQGFEQVSEHNIVMNELGAIGMGISSMDVNLDGAMDLIIGQERGKWHLFNNHGANNAGNYLSVEVGNSPKNATSPLGALVTVTACGNAQVKRLGATSAAYSNGAQRYLHFGLGGCEQVDTLTVTWPDGEKLTIAKSAVNQNLKAGS
ncbi:CRTAC1 family protein [Thalassotalea litorea]|uniref:CRTAC1 family protein n=1 Tax=Thalassotalea litorea TaxID=2020715 RepID=A0A5R9IFP5_9GAMM|nr:CRTAC1 family protein [Thalassotalea litorea]TLU64334.1 CRTAC1 family protein [Thalassotalea litorea]